MSTLVDRPEHLTAEEGAARMAAALERGVRLGRGVLLFAVYRAEITRAQAEDLLVARLRQDNLHVSRVYFPYGGDADWPARFADTAPGAREVFFLYNLREEFPALLDQLNYRREFFAEQRVRAVFWVTEDELTRLAEYAPDFFRFRTEVLDLLDVPVPAQRMERIGWMTSRDDEAGLSATRAEREAWVALREHLLAELGTDDSTRAARLALLLRLSVAYLDLSAPDRAIEYSELALALAGTLGNRRGKVRALCNLGTAYRNLGDARRAIGYYEQALALARKIKDRRGAGATLGNLGVAYIDLGETKRAIGYFEEDLALAFKFGDPQGVGATLGNLGAAYYRLGEAQRAVSYFEQSLTLAREIGDRRVEGTVLGNLGAAYIELGEPKRAIASLEQSLTLAREIGDRPGEATASWTLAAAMMWQGELTRAIELMKPLVAYEREVGHPEAERDAVRLEELRRRLPTES